MPTDDPDAPRPRPRSKSVASRRGADAVATGAARASGERARRRRTVTPLISGLPGDEAAAAPPAPPATAEPPATPSPRPRPAPPPQAPTAGAPSDGPLPAPVRLDELDEMSSPPVLGSSGRRARAAARAISGAAAAGESLVAELSRRPGGEEAGAGAELTEAERALLLALRFLRRRLTGDYQVDEFGFDAHLTDNVVLAGLRPLYRHWFRVDVRGVENIPATGGALVVANHSGTVALDSLMTQLAVHDDHPAHRHLRMLAADLVFATPVVGELARKSGCTLAGNPDAERLLSSGHLVGVWPEGFKGIGKPFSERYKLQRFGRGGFVAAALKTRVPIIPCSIVGAEEIAPILGNLRTLARLLGLPYLPITPTFPWLGLLGLVPLPSKWLIEFGTPIRTDDLGDNAAEDPMLVFDLTDRVRETIQQTLYSLLLLRRSVFR